MSTRKNTEKKTIVLTSLGTFGSYIADKLVERRMVSAIVVDWDHKSIKRMIYDLFHDESEKRRRLGIKIEDWTLPIYFVRNINKSQIIHELKPDLVVNIGGRKIKKHILELSTFINFHGGILPQYRGLDSRHWAKRNKDFDSIGITIHYMDERIDAGNIIVQKRTEDFFKDGVELVIKAIALVKKGYKGKKQDETKARYYGKMNRLVRCFY